MTVCMKIQYIFIHFIVVIVSTNSLYTNKIISRVVIVMQYQYIGNNIMTAIRNH